MLVYILLLLTEVARAFLHIRFVNQKHLYTSERKIWIFSLAPLLLLRYIHITDLVYYEQHMNARRHTKEISYATTTCWVSNFAPILVQVTKNKSLF